MKIILFILVLVLELGYLVAQHPIGHTFCGTGHSIQDLTVRSAGEFSSFTVNPAVVKPNQPFSITVGITLNNVDYIEMENTFSIKSCLYMVGMPVETPVEKFILKDDGTQGDVKAGDKFFTINQVEDRCGTIDGRGNPLFLGKFTIVYKNGVKEEKENIPIYSGYRVIPSRFKTPVVKKLNETTQHTEYVLNIVTKDPDANEEKAKLYYKYFPDDRDLLVFSTTHFNPNALMNAAGYYLGVKNNIKGLQVKSVTAYDDSKKYGSNGKLQGIIVTQASYSMDKFLITHELTHRWGMYFDPSLGLADFTHYGSWFSGTSGFGGAIIKSIEQKSNTKVVVTYGPNDNHFNNLELYLMGLLPIDSVPFPITVYEDITSITYPSPSQVELNYQRKKTVTKNDFLKVMDLRSPGPATSQKKFATALIVTSPRLLTPEELAYFDNMAREYEWDYLAPEIDFCNHELYPDCSNNNFNLATRGKATLTTRIATFENTTSVATIKEEKYKVFPNPVKNEININTPLETGRPTDYSIYDLTGRILETGKITHAKIKLQHNYPGILLLKLIDRATGYSQMTRLIGSN